MSRNRTVNTPQIIDEASAWFVAMREPTASADAREAFALWLRASPAHVGAYLEMAHVWDDAAHLSTQLDVNIDAVAAVSNVVRLREASTAARPTAQNLPRRLLVAASLLLGCLLGSLTWWQISRVPTYVAGVGEQRAITLEDGSTVRLNSRSKLSVRMSPQLRQIELLEGQALFEVTHDAARPFIVRSDNVAVRAVGTAFDVWRKKSGTIVTVIEGAVRVNRVEAGRPTSPAAAAVSGTSFAVPVQLSAGEQLTVTHSGQVEQRPNANVAAATSWLRHELVFDGEPLSAVLEEFNRYTRTPIVLTDDSLADLRISAVFHTTSPDTLMRYLARFESVEVEESDSEIRIFRRK